MYLVKDWARLTESHSLVRNKNPSQVIVALESVQNCGKGRELSLVPCRDILVRESVSGKLFKTLRTNAEPYLIKLCIESVQIKEQVDANVGESGHTRIMVACRVDMIDTYCICPQICHQARVEVALGAINERVVGRELIGNT